MFLCQVHRVRVGVNTTQPSLQYQSRNVPSNERAQPQHRELQHQDIFKRAINLPSPEEHSFPILAVYLFDLERNQDSEQDCTSTDISDIERTLALVTLDLTSSSDNISHPRGPESPLHTNEPVRRHLVFRHNHARRTRTRTQAHSRRERRPQRPRKFTSLLADPAYPAETHSPIA